MRAVAFAVALLTAPAAQAQVVEAPGAVLRALDKIDGRVADVTVHVGETASFGRLGITLVECRYPSQNPSGDAFALLEVRQEEASLFKGWMVASSPALNALDHPRYDVWVMRCSTS
ncbi:DUF2155 domain-containing protein [Roseitranquillus sediminis]|uniref:DUF2155 domain-containing protein n=1 Tax=Roseitranquillus sediminis TaxID=2809051 RepID=UPI001D0C8B7C|nr:DUF2155 domain-containing protein [Roseitranquillus sediminis]MBM9595695.1 DUF2155 domain-containing protein [Roseitranquillus sediminis]